MKTAEKAFDSIDLIYLACNNPLQILIRVTKLGGDCVQLTWHIPWLLPSNQF